MVQYSLGWRIADYEETPGRIQMFTRNGGFIKSWGGHGAGAG
jgi:hypothetical protein